MNQQQARTALDRATIWRASSYSEGENNCVEVSGAVAGWVGLRDSKNPHAAPLAIPRTQWRSVLAAVTAAQRP